MKEWEENLNCSLWHWIEKWKSEREKIATSIAQWKHKIFVALNFQAFHRILCMCVSFIGIFTTFILFLCTWLIQNGMLYCIGCLLSFVRVSWVRLKMFILQPFLNFHRKHVFGFSSSFFLPLFFAWIFSCIASHLIRIPFNSTQNLYMVMILLNF